MLRKLLSKAWTNYPPSRGISTTLRPPPTTPAPQPTDLVSPPKTPADELKAQTQQATTYFTGVLSKYGHQPITPTKEYQDISKKSGGGKYSSRISEFASLNAEDQDLIISAQWDYFYSKPKNWILDTQKSNITKSELRFDVWEILMKEIGFDFQRLLQFILFRKGL